MASHYSFGSSPARPRRPRDKAKVEAGVRFAQTYILGRLRRLIFFSLAECNEAIALVMQRMNERPMRNFGLRTAATLTESSLDHPAVQAAGQGNENDAVIVVAVLSRKQHRRWSRKNAASPRESKIGRAH